MTRERTPSRMLLRRGFSLCWPTARRVSSSGIPERSRVASCRVTSARSAAFMPRRRLKLPPPRRSRSMTSLIDMGSMPRSRSSWRTWRAVSPSSTPLCWRPPRSTAVYSKAPMGQVRCRASVIARDTDDFLESRRAVEHLAYAVVADSLAERAGIVLQRLFALPLVNHRLHALIHRDEFIDAAAPAIAAAVAGRAADGVVDARFRIRGETEDAPLAFTRWSRLPAVLAQGAHEALGDNAEQAGGEQERFYAHVAQPRHGAYRRVRMQRGEHEVAGETGLHRDLRRLEVADLADHHDVGVLAEDGPQAARKRHADLGVHLRLADAVDVVLDRVLDRHDVAAGLVDALEARVERRGLA